MKEERKMREGKKERGCVRKREGESENKREHVTVSATLRSAID